MRPAGQSGNGARRGAAKAVPGRYDCGSPMNRPLAALPSVDRLLRQPAGQALIARHGRAALTTAIRAVLADLRAAGTAESDEDQILAQVVARIERETRPSLRPVF